MYRSIVVPLDGSVSAEQALPVAMAIAKASGATTTLVRAWDPALHSSAGELTPPFLDANAPDRLAAAEHLDATAARLGSDDGVTVHTAVVAGRPADVIRECAADIGADLIVMTTHGRTGWSRAWLGSVADATIRAATVPVLLLRPVEGSAMRQELFTRVLIPLDGSTEGERILTHAMQLGGLGGASYTLVRVVRPVVGGLHVYTYAAPASQIDRDATETAVSEAREYLEATVRLLQAAAPQATIAVDVRLDERPANAIADAARAYNADLLALTTHARRGVRLVLGSVADKVLRGTESAMLVLNPTGD